MITSDFGIFLFLADDGQNGDERLRRAARVYTGEDDMPLKKEKAPGGKPFFPDMPQLHFSISHSGAYWACAMGGAEVGLDLQQHKQSDYSKLARRFFHPEEFAYLKDKSFLPEEFFGIWCAKESYIKYTGQGLPQGLGSFSVISGPENVQFKHVPFLTGYSLCICAEAVGEVAIYPLAINHLQEEH